MPVQGVRWGGGHWTSWAGLGRRQVMVSRQAGNGHSSAIYMSSTLSRSGILPSHAPYRPCLASVSVTHTTNPFLRRPTAGHSRQETGGLIYPHPPHPLLPNRHDTRRTYAKREQRHCSVLYLSLLFYFADLISYYLISEHKYAVQSPIH